MNKRKMITSLLLSISLILLLSFQVGFEKKDLTIKINGNTLDASQPPVLLDGHTFVPMRAIFNALGAEVIWDSDSRKITSSRNETKIVLRINDRTAYMNGQPILLETAPMIMNNFTMVPLRFVSESFGANVHWDQQQRFVEIKTIGDRSAPPVFDSVSDRATIFIEGCEAHQDRIQNTHYSYTRYQCHSSSQYSELGDLLLLQMREQGIHFLENLSLLDWNYDFQLHKREKEIISYLVQGNTISEPHKSKVNAALKVFQQDAERHQWLWDSFVRLIPVDYRQPIVEYMLFADEDTTGFVDQYQYDDHSTGWLFALNVLEVEPQIERFATMIHEFAHILTLGEGQVQAFVDEKDCSYLYADEGCSMKNSYVQQFYKKYWQKLEPWLEEYSEDPDELYAEFPEHFVNDYAATDVFEDIAESFTYFVLTSQPEEKQRKDSKVLFFYDYSELVKLRADILARLQAIVQNQQPQ